MIPIKRRYGCFLLSYDISEFLCPKRLTIRSRADLMFYHKMLAEIDRTLEADLFCNLFDR